MFYSITRVLAIFVLLTTLVCRNMVAQNASFNGARHFDLLSSSTKSGSEQKVINQEELQQLISQQPNLLTTTLITRESTSIDVQIKRTFLGEQAPKSSLHYTGHIIGKQRSLVTLKIENKGIKALLSDEFGNYELNTNNWVVSASYATSADERTHWECNSELLYNVVPDPRSKSQFKSNSSDTISIYFVCDYAMFESFGFSTAVTVSFVYDLFHQVQAIYQQENIMIEIADVYVWETPDPYDDSSTQAALSSFKSHLGTDFEGNFAHLLSASNGLNGGIGFIGGICNREYAFAYSNIDGAINQPGTYSWDVHVVAHEMGHNMGSPHTHDCAWGANGDEAIDGCGGPPPACDDAPIPQEGGTIMSYCHQANVGVNFSLGFGIEPGDLIRQNFNLCRPEVGEECESALILSEVAMVSISNIESGFGAFHQDAEHAKWFTFFADEDGTVSVGSCEQGIDTRLYIYKGDCDNLTEVASSDDDCLSESGYFYASEITDLELLEGEQIFIEWDNRWSSEGFTFEFEFISASNTCSNGIMDGNEEGIDCGGSCEPCLEPCTDDIIPVMIDSSLVVRTMNSVNYGGIIINPGTLTITTADGAAITDGFEIENGSSFEITLGDCDNQ